MINAHCAQALETIGEWRLVQGRVQAAGMAGPTASENRIGFGTSRGRFGGFVEIRLGTCRDGVLGRRRAVGSDTLEPPDVGAHEGIISRRDRTRNRVLPGGRRNGELQPLNKVVGFEADLPVLIAEAAWRQRTHVRKEAGPKTRQCERPARFAQSLQYGCRFVDQTSAQRRKRSFAGVGKTQSEEIAKICRRDSDIGGRARYRRCDFQIGEKDTAVAGIAQARNACQPSVKGIGAESRIDGSAGEGRKGVTPGGVRHENPGIHVDRRADPKFQAARPQVATRTDKTTQEGKGRPRTRARRSGKIGEAAELEIEGHGLIGCRQSHRNLLDVEGAALDLQRPIFGGGLMEGDHDGFACIPDAVGVAVLLMHRAKPRTRDGDFAIRVRRARMAPSGQVIPRQADPTEGSVGYLRAVVAGIPHAVRVGIQLVGIGDTRAVVPESIREQVKIRVLEAQAPNESCGTFNEIGGGAGEYFPQPVPVDIQAGQGPGERRMGFAVGLPKGGGNFAPRPAELRAQSGQASVGFQGEKGQGSRLEISGAGSVAPGQSHHQVHGAVAIEIACGNQALPEKVFELRGGGCAGQHAGSVFERRATGDGTRVFQRENPHRSGSAGIARGAHGHVAGETVVIIEVAQAGYRRAKARTRTETRGFGDMRSEDGFLTAKTDVQNLNRSAVPSKAARASEVLLAEGKLGTAVAVQVLEGRQGIRGLVRENPHCGDDFDGMWARGIRRQDQQPDRSGAPGRVRGRNRQGDRSRPGTVHIGEDGQGASEAIIGPEAMNPQAPFSVGDELGLVDGSVVAQEGQQNAALAIERSRKSDRHIFDAVAVQIPHPSDDTAEFRRILESELGVHHAVGVLKGLCTDGGRTPTDACQQEDRCARASGFSSGQEAEQEKTSSKQGAVRGFGHRDGSLVDGDQGQVGLDRQAVGCD